MFYKPNFCCECGEKIDRAEWKLWTSRRFCVVCEPERRMFDLVPKTLAGVCAVGVIFGLGSYLRSGPAGRPHLIISSASGPASAENPAASLTKRATAGPEVQSQPNPPLQRLVEPAARTSAAPERIVSNEKNEAIYMCGAATKKGTACSRRVKGNVRCWQHTGMPAILPPEKLKISGP